ncbi:MAG: ABC transporter ATP-binding protein [Promethearchaeota archaeon]
MNNRKKLLHSFGIVPQEISLYWELSARENLEFHGQLFDIPKHVLKDRIDTMIELAGLKDRQDDLVNTYSGGMKRRLQLVRALLHDPQIIILDEPTLGVDVQTRRAIHEYIIKLSQEGKTIVLTTNYMEEAEKLSDRICILDNKIVAKPAPLHNIINKHFPGTKLQLTMAFSSIEDKELFVNNVIIKQIKGEIVRKRDDDDSSSFLIMTAKSQKEILEFIMQFSKEKNASIESIQINAATLEDVFLKLTGKAFRDNT